MAHILDRAEDGSECRWARILAYEPPARVVFSWDIGPTRQLEDDPDHTSEVEVRFTATPSSSRSHRSCRSAARARSGRHSSGPFDTMHQSRLIELPCGDTVSDVRSIDSDAGLGEPPPFVRLTSNPLRWRLLRALVHSDRTVRELTALVDEPQSLVSYHLRLLREGGLVTARRSSADRRDSYYAIDLAACADALQRAGGALHPALRPAAASPDRRPARSPRRPPRVLFLCTGNSARSQIAEALLEHISGGSVRAASAGSHPKTLHPNAIRVVRTYGVDIAARRTKHLDELRNQRFDAVITLCDRVREVCPQFPSRPELVHWSVPDPALEGATDRDSYPAFVRTAAELETRITFGLPLLTRVPTARRPAHGHR